jgi:hypothetical protein
MSTSEETHWLEAELERCKLDLHDDLSRIEHKLQLARARLRPTTFMRDRALLVLGISLTVGFAFGFWDVPLGEIGQPLARTMLSTVGKQIAVRAIKG